MQEGRSGPVRTRARHRHVVIVTEAELFLERGSLRPLGHQLVEIGSRSQMVAYTAYDENLDVVVDARLEQEVRIPLARGDGGDVQLVGPVEGDRGDAGAGILLVENDLLR